MPDRARPTDMAVDRHVIGRVGKDHSRRRPVHQCIDRTRIAQVAAKEPVMPEAPEITGPCHGAVFEHRKGLVGGISRLFRPALTDKEVDLAGIEADHAKVEVEIGLRKGAKLDRQNLTIPARLLGQPVVCDHVGPLLILRHVIEPQAGNLSEPELPGCSHPAMTGKDAAPLVDQHGIGEPETLDAGSDLPDLFQGMGPRIAGPGDECLDALSDDIGHDLTS